MVNKTQKQNTEFSNDPKTEQNICQILPRNFWAELGKYFVRYLDNGKTWYFTFEIY